MFDYTGRTALVTGASSGLGKEFAYQLAAKGMRLVLTARSEQKLEMVADDLLARHGQPVEVMAADLTRPGSAEDLRRAVAARNLRVDLLVNNAGVCAYGDFETVAPATNPQLVALNVAALVAMTEAFAPAMLERRHGAIVNVASGAAFQPMPYMTTYAATKAFVLSFSEGLWAEYRRRGVHVMVFCPDHTQTPLVDALPATCPYATAPGADAAAMVASGLRGLERGRHYAVGGGLKAYLRSNLARWLPRATVALISESMHRARPAERLLKGAKS